MSIESPEKIYLDIHQLIYSSRGVIVINLTTFELDVLSKIPHKDGFAEVYGLIGGKSLTRSYMKGCTIYERIKIPDKSRPKGYRTDFKEKAHLTKWDAVARNMSVTFPITGDEVKTLCLPYMQQRIPKIYLATLANSQGVGNNFTEEKYGFINRWVSAGVIDALNPERSDWIWVNQYLKSKKSTYRIRTKRVLVRQAVGPDV